jgi:sugar phosphate isomerase/epimerase
MRVIEAADRENSGVLVDPIHFFRGGDSVASLSKIPGRRVHYMQFCDARGETPTDMQEIIRQARGDRLFPGEGGLDLKGLLAALPADLPMSLEVPVAQDLAPLERARRALEATKRLL